METKHYHFIGIGGIGMGALAYLKLKQGHRVSGSDLKDSEMTDRLKNAGAKVMIGHNPQNIAGADVIVYSSAISPDNTELQSAQKEKKAILKRAQLLAELMQGKIGITIAGAHGKTTTSSMVSDLLIKAGMDPTSAVGGVLSKTVWHASIGEGKYFVAEVDESDGSFLYFQPNYSIITNIDFEHVDYYRHWDNILDAYREFVSHINPQGYLIICGDDSRLRKLAGDSSQRFLTYGFKTNNDLIASEVVLEGFTTHFQCRYRGQDVGKYELHVPGRHNILNALACIGIGVILAIDPKVIKDTLKEFQSVRRRFQVKGQVNDIIVVDDYGHHPTEIRSTLEAARSLKKKRVIAVFQPHRYSRTKYLLDEFAENLLFSDYIVITDIYAASEAPMEGVSAEHLFEKIKATHRRPVIYLKKEEILNHLLSIIEPGDLVLTLGAGDITKISDELVQSLEQKYPNKLNCVK